MYKRKWLSLAIALLPISACVDSGSQGHSRNEDARATIEIPLDIPLMDGGEVLTPITTRSSGTSEMVFKVASFYAEVLTSDKGFEIKKRYADTRNLSLQGENGNYFLSIKGSTKLSQSPSSQSLDDDETRVLILARPKN